MNVITVGEGPLKGKFEGIDKNQINANMALLYFIENRISKMNGTPVPHPELIGLFSQLFNDTGLYSQEYMGGNKRGGGGGIFDTMYELFVSDSKLSNDMFNDYKKNSYLLLNMPNNYDIAINNFDLYPVEIKVYIKGLINQPIKQTNKQFSNIYMKNSVLIPEERENILLSTPHTNTNTEVFGGKTKKHIKLKKKTKGKKKTKKNKTKKRKRFMKHNKKSRRIRNK